jgi:hypothetical protein
MNLYRRLLIVTVTLSLTFCRAARAQEELAATATQTQDSSSVKTPQKNENESWHVELSPYLWLAGTHGTVGARGRNARMHASPGDLLSHFNFGLMGVAEARYDRFVLNGDMLWIRLSDSRALPFPALGAVSADVRVGQFLWTSKLGYRVIDREKMKADASVGVRYWHLGQKLTFNPSLVGANFNGSQDWVDIVVGGHVELPAGKKTVVDVAGDVGGWNATAKLDYQFMAMLGYKICPKATLFVGYRYLFVDYRPSNLSVYNTVTSGAVLGTTFILK